MELIYPILNILFTVLKIESIERLYWLNYESTLSTIESTERLYYFKALFGKSHPLTDSELD